LTKLTRTTRRSPATVSPTPAAIADSSRSRVAFHSAATSAFHTTARP